MSYPPYTITSTALKLMSAISEQTDQVAVQVATKYDIYWMFAGFSAQSDMAVQIDTFRK